MTTIRTTCPTCGEVDMGPEDIVLTVRDEGQDGTYRFSCPGCSQQVAKDADRKIVSLLVSAGVTVAEQAQDDVLADDRGRTAGFTLDDLIDLHYELEDDRALDRFLQGV